jgi:AraC family transcriptional regulator
MDTKIAAPEAEAADSQANLRGGIRPYVLARVIQLIDTCLHQPLHVEDLAREACLSPFHFARMFKQSTGQSPHAYLVARRLERARQMLVASDLSIREVSRLAGFSTHAHFCSVFRAKTGMTPAAYRRAQRAAAADVSDAQGDPAR